MDVADCGCKGLVWIQLVCLLIRYLELRDVTTNLDIFCGNHTTHGCDFRLLEVQNQSAAKQKEKGRKSRRFAAGDAERVK